MTNTQTIGSRAQVMHGKAQKTSGGLTKKQLKYNKQGKIVSRKASALATKNNRLVKAGYVTKKGKFGSVVRGGVILFSYGVNVNIIIHVQKYEGLIGSHGRTDI
jgi:hypothetical protein